MRKGWMFDYRQIDIDGVRVDKAVTRILEAADGLTDPLLDFDLEDASWGGCKMRVFVRGSRKMTREERAEEREAEAARAQAQSERDWADYQRLRKKFDLEPEAGNAG